MNLVQLKERLFADARAANRFNLLFAVVWALGVATVLYLGVHRASRLAATPSHVGIRQCDDGCLQHQMG